MPGERRGPWDAAKRGARAELTGKVKGNIHSFLEGPLSPIKEGLTSKGKGGGCHHFSLRKGKWPASRLGKKGKKGPLMRLSSEIFPPLMEQN